MREGGTVISLTLNLCTPLAEDQNSQNPLSSHSTPHSSHPAHQQSFQSIMLCSWDQAKPSNTKHLALIPICSLSAHSLARRGKFSPCTQECSHSGGVMQIRGEKRISLYSRPYRLTQLGFFSSQQDKIILWETENNQFLSAWYNPSGFSQHNRMMKFPSSV